MSSTSKHHTKQKIEQTQKKYVDKMFGFRVNVQRLQAHSYLLVCMHVREWKNTARPRKYTIQFE